MRISDWSSDVCSSDLVQEQIDATINDAIKRVRCQLPHGQSLTRCEECDATIPEARREAVPGVRLCVSCQQLRDSSQASSAGYNRRGSRSEEHTSELQSLMRISYAVFCLKKKQPPRHYN